jgi:hypothetical protein
MRTASRSAPVDGFGSRRRHGFAPSRIADESRDRFAQRRIAERAGEAKAETGARRCKGLSRMHVIRRQPKIECRHA